MDWGVAPTWAASLLTGGSLLLGFSILRQDRRTAERAQIDRVGVWVEGGRIDDLNAGIGIHLRNASVLPVKGVLVEASAVVVSRDSLDRALLRSEQREDLIGPGEAVDRVMSFGPTE